MKRIAALITAIVMMSTVVGTCFAYTELPEDTTPFAEQQASSEPSASDGKLSEEETTETEYSATEPTVTETDPSATEPTVTETEVSETEISETDPTVTEPSVTEPSVTEPSVTEPSVTEPTTTEPTHTEPTTVKPTEPKVIKVKKNKKLIHFSKKGKSKTLKMKISPGNADNKKVKWTTSNKKVAKVSQSGKITAKGKGHCYIKAMAKDGSKKSAKCLVVVGAYVKSLKLPKTIVLNNGKTKKLKVKVTKKKAAYKAVSWKSTNTKIAIVSKNGKVKALTKGKCTVTATSKDGSKKTAKCTVIVKQPITKISFEKSKVTVIRDKAKKLKVKVTPSNASSKALKWTSSNPKIATVSKNGNVKGRKFGTCTIKAAAKDGSGKTAKCKVKVTFDDNTPLTHKELCTKAVMQRVCDKMNAWYGKAGATIDDVLIGDTQYCLYSTVLEIGNEAITINDCMVSAMGAILSQYSEDEVANGNTWLNIKGYDFDSYAKWYHSLTKKDILDPDKSGWKNQLVNICQNNVLVYCYPVIDKDKFGTEYYIYFQFNGKQMFYPTDEDE